MEAIPKNRVYELRPDTVQALREQYNLNTTARINQAIDILDRRRRRRRFSRGTSTAGQRPPPETSNAAGHQQLRSIHILDHWIKKQNHFVKKDFSREYLERALIICKGSVEKTKQKLDKTCTCRSLNPGMFEVDNPKELVADYYDTIIHAVLPKLTDDHYRVYVLKNIGKRFDSGFSNYFRFIVMLCEYFQSNDYCAGFMAIFDYREVNMLELLKNTNLVELRQALSIIIGGYSFRVKGLHFITQSKAIDAFVSLFKQALSEKLVKRIHIHKDISTLAELVPLNILPVEYGGEEKSLEEIRDDLLEEMASDEFMDYLREMTNARTDESKRHSDKFNEQYLGMPGSFRALNVD